MQGGEDERQRYHPCWDWRRCAEVYQPPQDGLCKITVGYFLRGAAVLEVLRTVQPLDEEE